MATYRFAVDVAAPREQVFALWTNLERAAEWIGGMKDVIDISGPVDQIGTTYTVRFGSWATSPTTVIAAERPSRYATRFGNTYLRGENDAVFEDVGTGTRLIQEFRVQGLLPRLMARIWATGSYRGSFRGELNHFKEICEREAAEAAKIERTMKSTDGLRSLRNLRYLLPGATERIKRNRVAVIRLYGPINGGERSADWIELVRRTRESKRIPAVVLDVDSPGGAATASDNMYAALARLAEKKPLVAAIRGTGASGSYLAAIAAKRIVASPTSVIGSIGVITAAPRLPRLLDRIGVSVSEHTAGRLKGMGAPWREESEPEAAKEQQLVDEIYDVFVDRVATARGMTPERVRELATGEVWLGTKALELGLVDEIGDLERAVEIAADLAGVPAKSAVVSLPRPFFARLTDRFATGVADSVVRELESRLSDRIRL